MKSHAALLSKAPPTHLAFSKLVHVTAYLSAIQHTLLTDIHALNNTGTHTPLFLVELHTNNSGMTRMILTNTQYNAQAAFQ